MKKIPITVFDVCGESVTTFVASALNSLHGDIKTRCPIDEDCYQEQMNVDGKSVLIDIFTFCGQHEYSALFDQHIKFTTTFILLCRYESYYFNDINSLIDKIYRVHDKEKGKDFIPIVLVSFGREEYRAITLQQEEELAKNNEVCGFFRCEVIDPDNWYSSKGIDFLAIYTAAARGYLNAEANQAKAYLHSIVEDSYKKTVVRIHKESEAKLRHFERKLNEKLQQARFATRKKLRKINVSAAIEEERLEKRQEEFDKLNSKNDRLRKKFDNKQSKNTMRVAEQERKARMRVERTVTRASQPAREHERIVYNFERWSEKFQVKQAKLEEKAEKKALRAKERADREDCKAREAEEKKAETRRRAQERNKDKTKASNISPMATIYAYGVHNWQREHALVSLHNMWKRKKVEQHPKYGAYLTYEEFLEWSWAGKGHDPLKEYRESRSNGEFFDEPLYKFPKDGVVTWEADKDVKNYVFHIYYHPGEGDNKFMHEQDRNYIYRLLKDGPRTVRERAHLKEVRAEQNFVELYQEALLLCVREQGGDKYLRNLRNKKLASPDKWKSNLESDAIECIIFEDFERLELFNTVALTQEQKLDTAMAIVQTICGIYDNFLQQLNTFSKEQSDDLKIRIAGLDQCRSDLESNLSIVELSIDDQRILREGLAANRAQISQCEQKIHLTSDPLLDKYYRAYRCNLTGIYTGAQAIASGFVDIGERPTEGVMAKMGKICKEIISHIPIVGDIFEIAINAAFSLDDYLRIVRLKKFVEIACDFGEADKRFEEVARLVILAQETELRCLGDFSEKKARTLAKEFMQKYIDTEKLPATLAELVLDNSTLERIAKQSYNGPKMPAIFIARPGRNNVAVNEPVDVVKIFDEHKKLLQKNRSEIEELNTKVKEINKEKKPTNEELDDLLQKYLKPQQDSNNNLRACLEDSIRSLIKRLDQMEADDDKINSKIEHLEQMLQKPSSSEDSAKIAQDIQVLKEEHKNVHSSIEQLQRNTAQAIREAKNANAISLKNAEELAGVTKTAKEASTNGPMLQVSDKSIFWRDDNSTGEFIYRELEILEQRVNRIEGRAVTQEEALDNLCNQTVTLMASNEKTGKVLKQLKEDQRIITMPVPDPLSEDLCDKERLVVRRVVVEESKTKLPKKEGRGAPRFFSSPTLIEVPGNQSGSAAENSAFLIASSLESQIRGLTYQPVIKDGHCLYRAINYFLGFGEDVQFLRNIVAAKLEYNLEQYKGFVSLPPNKNIEEYLSDIRFTNEWAGDLEITILMKVLGRPIVIIGPEYKICNRDAIEGISGEPIFIFYDAVDHYDAFILNGVRRGKDILAELLTELDREELFSYSPQAGML